MTRGDLRRIYQDLKRTVELKLWKIVVVGVVANQSLSHVSLPNYVGFTGAGGFAGVLVIKAVLGARG